MAFHYEYCLLYVTLQQVDFTPVIKPIGPRGRVSLLAETRLRVAVWRTSRQIDDGIGDALLSSIVTSMPPSFVFDFDGDVIYSRRNATAEFENDELFTLGSSRQKSVLVRLSGARRQITKQRFR